MDEPRANLKREGSPAGAGSPGDGRDRPLRVAHTRPDDPDSDPRREIPVLGFRDYWYPVCSVHKVPRRKPRKVMLLGEPLCVFRGEDGVSVVSDHCPHRGASLSGGRCHYPGTVSCPYHGWTFDGEGQCVAVLSEGPDSRIPGRVGVRTYPTVTAHGVVFAWMGEGEPADPRRDLPLELWDGSLVMHDEVIWHANWRSALENLSDNHTPYVHRNAIGLLMQPFMKVSYKGARALIKGGAIQLTKYTDGTEKDRPYREYFEGVDGYWPKHRYRLLWARLFALRPLRWLWRIGEGYPPTRAYHDDEEWGMGPHMPGMQRISGGTAMFTRWCVPVDERTTREFYLWACRPRTRLGRLWERWIRYPIAERLIRNRNLSMQDGKMLEELDYDRPEQFSPFDVETVGWRRLAILSARHGGRHDRIPPEVIERLNASPRDRAQRASRAGAGAQLAGNGSAGRTGRQPERAGS